MTNSTALCSQTKLNLFSAQCNVNYNRRYQRNIQKEVPSGAMSQFFKEHKMATEITLSSKILPYQKSRRNTDCLIKRYETE